MRLAILHPFQFRLGRGIERFTWSLAGALAQRHVEVDLLTWRWPNPVDWGSTPPGMHVYQMPDFRYYRERMAALYYLGRLLRQQHDWVILYFAGYGEAEALRLLRMRRSQRYCIVFHFPREQVPHRYAEFHRYGLARQADRLVAVSQFVAQGVEAEFGKTCAVIGNGVDTHAFQPSLEKRAAARQQLGIDLQTPMLVSLAALEERKGIQWVIRALPELLESFPDLQYWVLGEGDHRAALEAECRALGVEKHVHLVGNIRDVFSYLNAADIGCLLSYGEAFPLTLLEFMAMELPVLTSRHPPYDDLVRADWGCQVDEQNTGAVAAQIRALLANPDQRKAMGKAGREQVLARYTWAHVADEYLRLLDGT